MQAWLWAAGGDVWEGVCEGVGGAGGGLAGSGLLMFLLLMLMPMACNVSLLHASKGFYLSGLMLSKVAWWTAMCSLSDDAALYSAP